VFIPFHYGGNDSHTSANELTLTSWDPVSKQPAFKSGAVRLTLLRAATGPAPAPTTDGSAPVDAAVVPTIGGPAAEAVSTAGA
jgi:predicted molibdopterin-dependent oxidoreductase YjgC